MYFKNMTDRYCQEKLQKHMDVVLNGFCDVHATPATVTIIVAVVMWESARLSPERNGHRPSPPS